MQLEGRTFFPPKPAQPSASQFNSSSIAIVGLCGQPKPDVLLSKACRHSNVSSGFLTRSKLASYPPAKCDQYRTAPDLVRSSLSSEKEGYRSLHGVDKTPDVLWSVDGSKANVDNQKILRRKSLARNLIPISSSTRPLGLPSSCSPSHYQRKLSRFRYRNIKNITSLSRPLLIG